MSTKDPKLWRNWCILPNICTNYSPQLTAWILRKKLTPYFQAIVEVFVFGDLFIHVGGWTRRTEYLGSSGGRTRRTEFLGSIFSWNLFKRSRWTNREEQNSEDQSLVGYLFIRSQKNRILDSIKDSSALFRSYWIVELWEWLNDWRYRYNSTTTIDSTCEWFEESATILEDQCNWLHIVIILDCSYCILSPLLMLRPGRILGPTRQSIRFIGNYNNNVNMVVNLLCNQW